MPNIPFNADMTQDTSLTGDDTSKEESNYTITHHSIHIEGKPLYYQATVGFLPLKSEGVTFADLFHVAYIKEEKPLSDESEEAAVEDTSSDQEDDNPDDQEEGGAADDAENPDSNREAKAHTCPERNEAARALYDSFKLEGAPEGMNGLEAYPCMPGMQATEGLQETLSPENVLHLPTFIDEDEAVLQCKDHLACGLKPLPLLTELSDGAEVSEDAEEEEDVDYSQRPITFVFNGGPGSSAIYTHMLAMGPRRAQLTPDGRTLPPPPRLIDNPHTWLSFTDLVFIDPVDTGFSEAPSPTVFFDVENDAGAVAEFIRRYLTEHDRWLSPIFVAGESYGGIRGAVVAWELLNDPEISLLLNGLVFISPALDMQVTFPDKYNSLLLPLFIPTMASTAWFHDRLGEGVPQTRAELLAETEAWALETYLPALLMGNALSKEAQQGVAEQMSRYTGLPATFILERDLRVTAREFYSELRRDEGLEVSRNDSRWDAVTDSRLNTTLSPVWNHYVRKELEFDSEGRYTIFSSFARIFWTWGDGEKAFNALPRLTEVMERNPYMKVFVASGYYDFAVPYFVIDYTLKQLQIEPELRENITHQSYEAGHLVYTPEKELARFTEDMKVFYGQAFTPSDEGEETAQVPYTTP